MNGDGYADLAVGAPSATNAVGKVHVYHGSATGLRSTPAASLLGPDGGRGLFGAQVVGIEDINGDGYGDLASVNGGNEPTRSARTHIYFGSASGLGSAPGLSLTSSDSRERFGRPAAGDIDGDGHMDLVVTGAIIDTNASGSGVVHLHRGSTNGRLADAGLDLVTLRAARYIYGISASTGDLDGDGNVDLAVGTQDWTGRSDIFWGGAGRSLPTHSTNLANPARESEPYISFGVDVASAGDLNGDGYADLVVGARGRSYVYLGSASGVGSTPNVTISGPAGASGSFGVRVTNGGDLDGDGYSELVIGDFDANGYAGRVHIYRGGVTGPPAAPSWTLAPPTTGRQRFGGSVSSGQ